MLKKDLYTILYSSLENVAPEQLVKSAVHRIGDSLKCDNKEYVLNKNVYVVGFGKAVYRMFGGLYPLINDHIVKCILSVPHEFSQRLSPEVMTNSNVRILVGAKNNLPDQDALYNAAEISALVKSLLPDDFLILLISGGGSALLPSLVPGVSLDDKLGVINLVAKSGGNIKQLNIIRKNLSSLKGGKLIGLCSATNVLSLIISDIVNDPIDLIASGPTVYDGSSKMDCFKIFDELNLKNAVIPESVLQFLQKSDKKSNLSRMCHNVIIGSNKKLAQSAANAAISLNYEPVIISTDVEADAEQTGRALADIVFAFLSCKPCEEIFSKFINFPSNDLSSHVLESCKRLCLITAGETTVKVTGDGKGGRNQHLTLAFLSQISRLYAENNGVNIDKMCFLSAGSDGQDGPTDAAGAICDAEIIKFVLESNIDVDLFISNCNSYSFFSDILSGNYLLKTGLTGTNVMDIQLILIDRDIFL
ncbi:glycerate kinase isoform X1 [Hydra vulgaris]|uniref:glycerate kinase isoform X1 n=1 Tax=Hydra vulgaris TaxID=6087 RepID=UPI001F5F87A9|nr:glycerate kinase isoform X1 [Hydra vulgaris]